MQAFLKILPAAVLPFFAIQGVAAPFVDATTESGLDFRHFNGMSGQLYFPEMVGAGGALFDYDNDGDLDLYLVQGRMLSKDKTLKDAVFKPAHPLPLTDRLYRNDLSKRRDGTPRAQFTDVTAAAGLSARDYGMGVAAGDIDNDGDVDLYVTNFGANRLLINQGDGRFTDRTRQAGVGDERWSVSASFVDIDRDGWLDLYVGNYVDFTFDNVKTCLTAAVQKEYCGPAAYTPYRDRLYRNLGNGRFADISEAAGITTAFGGALGVIAADFNNDSWIDIYVANDGVANQLWLNRSGKRFENDALLAGVAVNMDGSPEASMGVDAADFDGDGDIDLFMTHLNRETNTLYINDGTGLFEDRTVAAGLAEASFPHTGFGMRWLDYDNDGLLDLLLVNGAVYRISDQLRAGEKHPLKESNQLFHNLGGGRYAEVSASSGAAFSRKDVSRGAIFGDIDNDGDTDVIVTNNGGTARLLINTAGNKNYWLGVRVLDRSARRDAYGARVGLLRKGQATLWRRVASDGSYASASDPRVLFGLGQSGGVHDVEVRWPDGRKKIFAALAAGRYHTLKPED